MDQAHPEIVVIKRHGDDDDEHHGGAWKIAFADFMTAMMAFFLVLWIINATDKDTKTIIARYFNPVKLEDTAKAQKGIRDTIQGKVKGQIADSEIDIDGPSDETQDEARTKSSSPGRNGADGNQGAHNGRGGRDGVKQADSTENGMASVADPAKPQPTLSETSLFKDPYASLDEIAGKPAPPSSSTPLGIGRNNPIIDAGTMDSDAFRDPFQPIARASGGDPLNDAKPESPQPPARPITQNAQASPPAVAAQQPSQQEPAKPAAPPQPVSPSGQTAPLASTDEPNKPSKAPAPARAPIPAEEAAHGAAKSPAKLEQEKPAPNGQSAEVAQLRSDLLKEIGGDRLEPGPGLEVQATDEGLLISLTDQFDFSMFPVGSAQPQARVVRIMEKVAQALKNRPGVVVVRGHTDARPYRSATYDNWRLSEARAQMAYYMLVRGGLPEKRVERIEGYADRRLKLPNNPMAAENRRIEILLRKPNT
jgi:chemotaxis protein MotB